MKNNQKQTNIIAPHTPRPWKTHNNIGRKSELGIIADKAPCIIATMCGTREWPAEARANARLIAAAPDLLAALSVLISLHDNPLSKEVWAVAISKARAVIAKAQGGSK